MSLAKGENTEPSSAWVIQEAVFRLCHYSGEPDATEDGGDDGDKNGHGTKKEMPRPCTLEEAKILLTHLRVERYRFSDLDRSVKLLATGVLAKGGRTG